MRRGDDLGKEDGRNRDKAARRHEADWVVREEGPSGKPISAGVVGVLLLIFILQNTNEVQVDFLLWDGEFPLWGVIVVSSVLGFLGGWILGRVRRTRREIERLEGEAGKD